MYVPAGNVIPGNATGWLNVKYVRLSDVKALAPLASAQTSTTNTDAEANLFTMLVLLPTTGYKMPADNSAAVEDARRATVSATSSGDRQRLSPNSRERTNYQRAFFTFTRP
jgi:hypothetical protein